MPLKPGYKEKTLVALRSGLYEQARGSIGVGNRLCCIGVAASSNYVNITDTSDCARNIGLTYDEEREWVYWNDTLEFDFNQIAGLIEQNY